MTLLIIILFNFGANAALSNNKCERIKVMVDGSMDVSLDGKPEQLKKVMPTIDPKNAQVELMRLSSQMATIYLAFCNEKLDQSI